MQSASSQFQQAGMTDKDQAGSRPETCTVLATSGTVHDDARLRRRG
jgi:hypothetical protein